MSTDSVALPDSAAAPAAVAASATAEPAPPAAGAQRHVAFEPLKGSELVLGTIALSLATFMNVLDTSIANVSIPAIAGDLGVSPAQGTWVITSFAVANAISVPLTGWLTQRFGQVRLFTTSIVLFVIASWMCGLAPNIGMLIAFRVLQGFVAGPMIPLSQTLLLASYPRAKAGTAMAMWAMTVLVAPVAGPLLGGWITDNMSWPWIFYINIPVGLFAAALTWSIYHKRDPGPRRVPLDFVGLGLLILFVGAMQIMIDKGKELDWFSSTQIVTLAVNSRTWPKRCVSQPVSGTEIAFATANEVMTQVPCAGLTPMSPAMAGIDTLAIDVSSTFMKVASDSAIVPSTSSPPVSGAKAGGRMAAGAAAGLSRSDAGSFKPGWPGNSAAGGDMSAALAHVTGSRATHCARPASIPTRRRPHLPPHPCSRCACPASGQPLSQRPPRRPCPPRRPRAQALVRHSQR